MQKSSHIDYIMQNLDNLTLAELLVLRAKADILIEEKYSLRIKTKESKWFQFLESEANQDKSLETVINLVNEWMADESDYDEETYSSIEPALNRNQLSL
ncbi:hypothetical protein BCD64_02670 [Nostoc sp. MBR 210]|nr:hypothetical protein BCD64_02670 [Nostoc sp. MBR 210]